MDDELLVGIDVGTTAVKATVFSLQGNILQHLATPYPIERHSGNHVEQNPADWMDAILTSLHRFESRLPKGAVKAIGLTSQVNTHVFVDDQGYPVLPAWVWQDGRAAREAQAIDGAISEAERLQWWGAPLPVDASHVLSRMQHAATRYADLWPRIRHVMLPKDYCIRQLTGACLSDPLSNIGAVDMQGSYVSSLMARLEGARQRLPELADMCSVAGPMRNGLPFCGVPVAVGTMDAWAGVFGTGTLDAGSGMYLSGTSEILGILSDNITATPGVLVMPRIHDMTLHVGPTQSGGASQSWFCDLMGITPEKMSALAASHDRRNPYPLFLPHLQGERAPLWDAHARGVFLGLDASTDQAALALAVYDGVACSARWLLESLQTSAGTDLQFMNAGGGGFRQALWNQLRSDVLGMELRRVTASDPGTLGAAGLGAVAAGLYDSPQAAFRDLVLIDTIYEPNTASSALHEERMALYRQTYENTRSLSLFWS